MGWAYFNIARITSPELYKLLIPHIDRVDESLVFDMATVFNPILEN
jgi:hypothetical protein